MMMLRRKATGFGSTTKQAHRLAELAMQLAAQHVEVVGRRGAVDDLPVALLNLCARQVVHLGKNVLRLLALLKKALKARTRVLWAHALKAGWWSLCA